MSRATTARKGKRRVLSGLRPTGFTHIGHIVGALENWVRLQDDYECFYTIVDWHALTTEYQKPDAIRASVLELFAEWLAVGVDPERSVVFVQSHVPQHAELYLAFAMVTPVPWLERVPTYKEQQQELAGRDLSTYGFLGYPVLQTADIALYKADVVPVGEDQIPHLELSREMVRRFNHLFGKVFPEPEPKITKTPRLPGTDGRKMSKSYGNSVNLQDDGATLREKILTMKTDPARMRRGDPGNPDVCPVYDFHKAFSKPDELELVNRECRTAGIGCVDCKKIMLGNLEPRLAPMRERRGQFIKDKDTLRDVLRRGAERAREEAERTMQEVRDAMGLVKP
ncbi:MAG: tryptophan--tRNA ligase [Acidobacteriota bacterium]|nr:MAG: tryptophan--tRNA ligase [Acidobacteriota bacterium]